MKIKTYVMTVSRYFPSTHPRKGQETHFVGKICRILQDYLEEKHGRHAILDVKSQYSLERWWNLDPKIHTMRANYELWEKRINEVRRGKAILSLRYWSGKPYKSTQVEFAQLDKDSGIGIQKIRFPFPNKHCFKIDDIEYQDMSLSKNDGLSYKDFHEWFKGYDLSKPMAIIHFTSFRY